MRRPSIPRALRARRPRLADRLGWGAHALILAALVVDLWVGGAFIEARFGHAPRAVFEIALIGAWLILVVGMRWWGDRTNDRGDRER
jgi:hypothetical protein